MPDLDQSHLSAIQDALADRGSRVRAYLFGSRVSGAASPYSDLDLALDAGQPLALAEIYKLAEQLAESDLPFRVDIVDLHRVSPEFREMIEPQLIPLESARASFKSVDQ